MKGLIRQEATITAKEIMGLKNYLAFTRRGWSCRVRFIVVAWSLLRPVDVVQWCGTRRSGLGKQGEKATLLAVT